MSQKPFRWGILGTGLIAQVFADDVQRLPDHKVVAVGSRSQARADAFGDQFGVPCRHPGYQALVNDPDVDGIYVATHHPMHMRDTLLALNERCRDRKNDLHRPIQESIAYGSDVDSLPASYGSGSGDP